MNSWRAGIVARVRKCAHMADKTRTALQKGIERTNTKAKAVGAKEIPLFLPYIRASLTGGAELIATAQLESNYEPSDVRGTPVSERIGDARL